MNQKTRLAVLLLAIVSFGCAMRRDLETPFKDPTNTPVINNGDKFCQPDSHGKFDGAVVSVDSGMNADRSAWAQGGGCVLRPIREAWAAIHNLEAMRFHGSDSATYVRTVDPTPQFTHLYEITYYKNSIIGTLNWTIEWYHGFDRGTFQNPERVNVNYQRTKGTSNLSVWQGGIVLTKISDTVTSVAVSNTFRARQSSSDNEDSARSGLNELIRDIRSVPPDWHRLDDK